MSETDYTAPFTIHYGTFSLWSTMARLTFALRGSPLPSRPEMTLHKTPLSIAPQNPEQLSEEYLTKINPKGQVPALVGPPALLPGGALADSEAISYFFADWYPSLLPKEHEAEIRELAANLRQVNLAILTFGVKIPLPPLFIAKIGTMLEQDDISAEYREALENKLKFWQNAPNVFNEANLEIARQRAKDLFSTIQSLRERNGTADNKEAYIYGTTPTLLDAHILPALARISDVGRKELIPPQLLEWADHFRQGPVWKEVIPGYSTLPQYN